MHRSTNYAYELNVHQLYKYRAYQSAEEKQRVHDIISNNRLYFGRPSQMDDELEGKPLIYFRRLHDDDATRAMLIQDAERVWRRQLPPPSVEDTSRWRN